MASIYIRPTSKTASYRASIVAFLVANGDDGKNIADPTAVLITDYDISFSKIVNGVKMTKILNLRVPPDSFNLGYSYSL
mgnify:CR=1 FL=1